LNDINGRVAGLLKGQAAEWAENWLVATAISGRKVFLAAVEGESPGVRREYDFSIMVGARGYLSIASSVLLKLPQSHVDVPILIGGNDKLDACGSTGEVVGLDPKGDGFLSVQSGPGGRPLTGYSSATRFISV
jgi:hypothetical protein